MWLRHKGKIVDNKSLINRILESTDSVRELIELAIIRDTYTELKGLAKNNYQRVPVGKWSSAEPVSIQVYDQPLRIAFTFFNANDTQARQWITNYAKKNSILISDITSSEKPVHYDIKVSDFSSKTKPLDGVNTTYTCLVDAEDEKQKLACSRELVSEDSVTTVEAHGTGYFVVSFIDGLNDLAFHCSLAQVMQNVVNQVPYREPKSISWVSGVQKRI